MKTEALYKLHERAQAVIDLIKRCDQRIEQWNEDLQKVHYQIVFGINYMKGKKKRLEQVKLRLIKYYLEITYRIVAIQPELLNITETEADLLTQQNLS